LGLHKASKIFFFFNSSEVNNVDTSVDPDFPPQEYLKLYFSAQEYLHLFTCYIINTLGKSRLTAGWSLSNHSAFDIVDKQSAKEKISSFDFLINQLYFHLW